ncbi:MAG: DUF1800 family protein, partial [Telluria sp.]
MPVSHDDCLTDIEADTDDKLHAAPTSLAMPVAALLAGAALSACGGGGGGGSSSTPTPTPTPPPVIVPPEPVTPERASRFLAQASMGANREQIAKVQSLGYSGWLDEQFALPASGARWDWLVAGGYNVVTNKNSEAGADACQWRKLLSAPDTLRQRVTLALSEILVAAVAGFVGSGWKAFSAAAYLDLLEENAFGNYRTLLQHVSLSAPMGEFLTYRNNVKFNPSTGAMPDE